MTGMDDRAALTAALFGQRGVAAYHLLFNGRRYATQWSRPLSAQADLGEGSLAIESFLELDPTVLGEGGAVRRGRSLLVLDRDLRPTRYLSEVSGAQLLLSLTEAHVRCHLPDGSVRDVPREGAAYVLEAYYPALDALMLFRERERLRAETSLRVFLVNQLISLPYGLRPAQPGGGLRLRSSFSEDLSLDEGGLLLRSASAEHGVETVRADPPPPLPPWHERPWEKQEPAPASQPPRYTPPASPGLRAEDVMIAAPAGPLGGTLTLPLAPGDQRLPALLFWGGSGSYDRHGISGELDLGFHETVDHLTACGFIGLRCDTRGSGSTPTGDDDLGLGLDAGMDAILSDAGAAFAYLAARPEVDPARLFLVGQSQGCTIVMRLAIQLAGSGRQVRGLALLAPMGRPFDEVARDQVRVHGRQVGLSEEQIAAQLRQTDELMALVRDVPVWRPGEVPDRYYAQRRSLPWLRELLAHPPAQLIQKVRAPVLICHGERDFQVDPVKDGEALCAAGRAAGVDVRLLRFPGLDHLFRRVPEQGTSTLASYYDGRTRPVDPDFLAALGAWMRELAGGAASA